MAEIGPKGGQFNRFLQATFEPDELTPAPDVGSQILPTFDVGRYDDPAALYLRGERLCAGHVELAAGGAGNIGKIGLLNPASSGILAVVTQLELYNLTGATNLFYGYVVPGGYGPGIVSQQRVVIDSRYVGASGGPAVPVCTVNSVNTDAVAPGVIGFAFSWRLTNNNTLWRNVEIVLQPGWAFWTIVNATNVPYDAAFRWRERALGSLEAQQP